MINKLFLFLIIAAFAIILIVLVASFNPFTSSVDNIGGKYSAVITHTTNGVQLKYTDESGTHTSSNFDESMKAGLLWINSSTPEDAAILCWWDYGHMIKAVGERNVIIRNPSKEILDSIADPTGIKEFDPNEKIQDVAKAFATDNQIVTEQIMAKYNATYIMVGRSDIVKSPWMFKAAGLNYTGYLDQQGFTDLGKATMIARLLDDRNTGAFTLVYQDEVMRIYKLSGV